VTDGLDWGPNNGEASTPTRPSVSTIAAPRRFKYGSPYRVL
jgi:hypothetical protein